MTQGYGKISENYYSEFLDYLITAYDELNEVDLPDVELDQQLDKVKKELKPIVDRVSLIVKEQEQDKLSRWIESSKEITDGTR